LFKPGRQPLLSTKRADIFLPADKHHLWFEYKIN